MVTEMKIKEGEEEGQGEIRSQSCVGEMEQLINY
jgi:hypothetical protein